MDGLMVAVFILIGFEVVVIALCLILVFINTQKVSSLWFIHLNVIICLGFACFSIVFYKLGNDCIFNFSKSLLFFNFFLKLIINTGITIRLYFKKDLKLTLVLESKNKFILVYNLSIFVVLVLISFILFKHDDIFSYFGMEFLLIISIIVILMSTIFCIEISKKNVKLVTNIEILIKVILMDSYFYSIIISMISFEDFDDSISLFCCFFIFCLYTYTNSKFMMKYDQAEYWNKSRNYIYKDMKLYKFFFMLNEKIPNSRKIRKEEKLFDQENSDHSLNHVHKENENSNSLGNKEFIYLNFCLLNTFFLQKISKNNEQSIIFFDRVNTNDSVSFFISNYEKYFNDANFSLEKLKSNFDETTNQEEVNFVPHYTDKFTEVQTLLNINSEMLMISLDPVSNIKICHRFEKKIQENKEKNDFSSFDCFLGFEIYPYEKFESIKYFLNNYFDYLQTIKGNFSKTFLPLFIGCFEIMVFDLKYVILLSRNNHAFSTFHEMKYCTLICFDDLKKEINYSSNQISNSFMNFFEFQNFNSVHLIAEEFDDCYKIFENDMKFLSEFLKTKFKVSLFLVNDQFIFCSEKIKESIRKDGENHGGSSQKFDESIIENFSRIEQIDINSAPSTLSQFEEIYIINIKNRNSRLIIKINFFELFHEETFNETENKKYLKE